MSRPLGLGGRGLRLSPPRRLGPPTTSLPPPYSSPVLLVSETGDCLVTESGAPLAAESS
jgi:hypothetical protein